MHTDEFGGGGPLGFFVRRWRRQVPLDLLFWRDMVLVGTLINIGTAFASLMALGFKADLAVVMLVFFLPLPYNIFLVGAVWRTAELVSARLAWSAKAGSALWLVIATLI